jgi:hypothetical protein
LIRFRQHCRCKPPRCLTDWIAHCRKHAAGQRG